MPNLNAKMTDRQSDHRQILTLFVLTGLLVLVAAAIMILAAVPPVSRDALTHHLAVPKLYLKYGGIYEIPHLTFSYYPMNLDLLYLLPLYFGNDIFPKYIHFMFALLTAGMMFRYLKKRLGLAWGLMGALIFLSLPIIVKLSITVYVDLGLVFFSTAAVFSLIDWIENRYSLKFLIAAAVYCGLALGTKYNGLVALFILTVSVPYSYIVGMKSAGQQPVSTDRADLPRHQLKAVGYALVFFSVAILVFSPWMIRNYLWKGNPIYPLYHGLFANAKPPSNDVRTGSSADAVDHPDTARQRKSPPRWGPLAIRKVLYQEAWWEIALVPLRIFFQGQDDSPKYFDGKLNPFLLLLPLLAFIPLRSGSDAFRTEKKILAAFIGLFILYAFLQIDMRIRYIAPVIPPAVILAVFGLHRMTQLLERRWPPASGSPARIIILLVASALLTYNGAYIYRQFNYVKPFDYLSGQTSRDDYIVRYRPEYSVVQYMNQTLPPNARVLALFLGNRGYYCDRDIIFGDGLFKKIVKNTVSADMIQAKLQKMGLTNLLIRYDLFNRWADSQFNHHEKELLKVFWAEYMTLIVSKYGYGLFELKQT